MQYVDAIFKYGHHAFNDKMIDMMRLHSSKNQGYAGGGSALGNFKRIAEFMKQYPNFRCDTPQGVAIMYLLKHLDRVMWDHNNGKFPSAESLQDLAVYFTIIACMDEDRIDEYRKDEAAKAYTDRKGVDQSPQEERRR